MTKLTEWTVFRPEVDEDGNPKSYERFTAEGSVLKQVVIQRTGEGVTISVDHRWRYHSPSGLEYGYGGSGPSDLALNILGAFVPPPEAWRLHLRFKNEIIAHLASHVYAHTLPGTFIREWIMKEWDLRKPKKPEEAGG